MAVVEIAKIQVRRGDARSVGMPQLDTGEFGWAITGTHPNSIQPELYIGNKTADGASLTTNTRILTALDLPNIFGSSISTSTYIYDGNKLLPNGTGVTLHTGGGGTNTSRTVKERLNDVLHAADYGILSNDDATSTSESLQRLFDQIYLNADKAEPSSRVEVIFPAGTFYIGTTIFGPPYVTIRGAGQMKTMFVYGSSSPCFQFVDGSSAGSGSYVTLNNMNSASNPTRIEIRGVTFAYDVNFITSSAVPLVRADCATNCIFDNVGFLGQTTAGYGTNSGFAGIDIRCLGGLVGSNLKITNCTFQSLNYGIKSNYDVEDTVIDSCSFTNMYRGIVFGEAIASGHQTGPKRSKITRNSFNTIAKEAVYVGALNSSTYTNHIISQNTFNNVGNNSSFLSPGLGDVGGETTSVIRLDSFGNVSDNDYFSRFTSINNTSTEASFVIPISGHASIVDNRVRVKLTYSGTPSDTLVKVAHSGYITNIKLQYHMTSESISRWGELYVVLAQNQIVDITDNYRVIGNNDGGIIFNAQYSTVTNAISIVYSGNSSTGQITYQINQYY